MRDVDGQHGAVKKALAPHILHHVGVVLGRVDVTGGDHVGQTEDGCGTRLGAE